MTLWILQEQGHMVSVIFNGEENKSTETIIKEMTGVNVIGRINNEPYFDNSVIQKYADVFREKLEEL